MPLTNAKIIQTKPTEKAQKLFDGGGLYLEVTPTGAKYWRLKYRFALKENRLSLGVFPLVGLKQARELADDARKLVSSGTDPSQARRLGKLATQTAAANTFELIALEWHKTKASGWSTSHTDTTLERMRLNLFPWLGKRTLIDIEAPELLATLRRIESRGAIDTTHRVKSILSNVFRFAIATGRASRNPAADLGAALKTTVKGHHPAIVEPVRFGQLLRDIEAYSGSNITRAALQIHALTFQRPNEVSSMAWAEIDLDNCTWVIPPSRMKNVLERKAHGESHKIPLSTQAVDVLRDLYPLTGRGALVFPSERGQGRCISENTARQALRSMGYTDHTPHGFRASVRTMAREHLHFDKEVIERQLSHGSDEALGGAYDRTQFHAERVRLMTAWADYMDLLRAGGSVVQLKRLTA